MADPHAKPVSPISQVLQSIGLTRDDLLRHSDQMRQFLTTEDANSLRAFAAGSSDAQSAVASAIRGSRTRSHSRSLSRPSASTLSQTPPPSTPVKSEPIDPPIPLRHMDSMEMILERKNRQAKREKRGKKEKERSAPSPSPASAAFSLDAFMQSRDSRRVPSQDQSESSSSATPQETQKDTLPIPPVTPQHKNHYRDYDTLEHPSRPKKDALTPAQSPTPTRSRATSISSHALATLNESLETSLVTPRRNHYYKSPLPSSSPPQSSPFATPSTKRVVNLVSSPGPMGPPPDEDQYDVLPYKLPPGPYSTMKPELSYAALIGQAILSSPNHRLTLQEIYDWITIVYPYFKRNETTWMNSIRHVLSTTVCFRKVVRDRSLGRTQWAIWDCDLECFANGNFRKEFCAELRDAAKKQPKKRAADDSTSGRKSKRQKKAAMETSSPAVPTAPAPQMPYHPSFGPIPQFLPLFPPLAPTHHQSYYDHCTQLPAEVIFPPLPPSSNYIHVTSTAGPSQPGTSSVPPSSSIKSSDISPPQPSSLPALTPNYSSSSPQIPSEDQLQTHDDVEVHKETPPLRQAGSVFTDKHALDAGEKQRANKTPSKKYIALPPMPESPTLDRRTKPKRPTKRTPAPLASSDGSHPRPCTPPPRPSTPRNRTTAQLSAVRTPLSHKGLHMSPSASLAHYKSHLDPPPPPTFHQDDGINPAVFDIENVRTPSRKRGHRDSASTLFPPITPKKLVFPTPGSATESPFRTPGSRTIFDPHDPSALLDEEFARLGAKGIQASPVGLFADRPALLYESPSPGKLPRWF